MAYVHGRSPFGDRQSSSSLVFEEFVPPAAWTEDSTCHYLLVDLPGFKKQELKLQVDNQTHILVSGERQVRENKYKRFEQSFELPKDADIEKITGKLEGEILYISVPKKVEQEHQEIKHGIIPKPAPVSDEDEVDDKKSDAYESNGEQEYEDGEQEYEEIKNEDDDDKKSNAYETEDGEKGLERKKHSAGFDDNWGQDADFLLRLAMEKLKKNKKIVATAIFAFSLGVLDQMPHHPQPKLALRDAERNELVFSFYTLKNS
ncbi:hypothetical protein L1987_51732 [Smallanthus sonchifolius]|uniref:Uncharacterized protein n=1 Tax=Smallanthus sonchifolius TaxID=185202 RepID=A0ACB9ERF7_9ASTR|nr:hypothetical protein L1987_51732 [Smallanthus sonchifolius]